MTMVNIKINNTKNFLPYISSKGSLEQRFQKARTLNLKFYDELQNVIKKDEITPSAFSRVLKKVIGAKLAVHISNNGTPNCTYMLNEIAESVGYALSLPLNCLTGNVQRSSAPVFLKETQNLLNEALNPKIFKRFANLLRRRNRISSIMEFYDKNLTQKKELNLKELDKLLEKKSNPYKIDVLQFLRYRLMSEKNTKQAAFQIDKRIEKHNCLKYERPASYYNLDKYNYDEKIEVLNSKLLNILQEERS